MLRGRWGGWITPAAARRSPHHHHPPSRPCALGRAPISGQGGSQVVPTHTGHGLAQVPTPPVASSALGLPLTGKLEGGGPSSCHVAEPAAAHRGTDAAFVSLVTDGGSIWGLFVKVFFFLPWLLLLLSSIFNFPINQRAMLLPRSFFLLESPPPTDGPPRASVGGRVLGREAQRFQPLRMGQGLEGTTQGGPSPPTHGTVPHSWDGYLLSESLCVRH